MPIIIDLCSYFLIILFFSSLISYILSNKHFLLMLVSLEAMMLSVYTLMFLYFSYFGYEKFINMIYLSLSVCEGALGLTLLVVLIRTHGVDTVAMFDNLW